MGACRVAAVRHCGRACAVGDGDIFVHRRGGSSRLWDVAPSAMGTAMARHDELLRSAVEARGGYVFSTGGDGFAVAFAHAGDAIAAAAGAQSALASEAWPADTTIRVRIGLHTGTDQPWRARQRL